MAEMPVRQYTGASVDFFELALDVRGLRLDRLELGLVTLGLRPLEPLAGTDQPVTAGEQQHDTTATGA